jgi:hypothetical protein
VRQFHAPSPPPHPPQASPATEVIERALDLAKLETIEGAFEEAAAAALARAAAASGADTPLARVLLFNNAGSLTPLG